MSIHEDYPEYITIAILVLASLSGLIIKNQTILIITALIIGGILGKLWHTTPIAPIAIMGAAIGFTLTSQNIKLTLLALFTGAIATYFLSRNNIRKHTGQPDHKRI